MPDAGAAPPDLEDRDAIAGVLVRYARSVDDRDLDAAGMCFTDDAEAEYGGRRLEPGRAGIVAYLRARTASLTASTHFMGNMSITVSGAGASAVTDGVAYLVFAPAPGGAPLVRVRGLRYDDELVREPDGWRIRRRTHQARWMFDAAAIDPSTHRLGAAP